MELQATFDKAAISVSVLCAVHCLAMPLIPILFLSVLPAGFDGEAIHIWLLLLALPLSATALILGCRKHRRHLVSLFGAVALLLLAFAGVFGHDYLGELGEKTLTLVAGLMLAAVHVVNYRTCRAEDCDCLVSQSEENSLSWKLS